VHDVKTITRPDRMGAQTLKAYAALRQIILGGELPPGTRLSEMAMVDRLGVSRTPARMAMMRLREEGLVEPVASGGFAVRGFDESDILAAIEIRATLEGLAARFTAERRLAPHQLDPLRSSIFSVDDILALPADEAPGEYGVVNDRFHAILAELADCVPLSRQLERVSALPFAAPSALVLARSKVSDFRTMLIVAHDQHQSIVEALERHEGTRAENLTREHTRLNSRNLARVLRSPEALALVPGAALILAPAAPSK
jgi:GntR family transcriptional regulator, vanillate catabolism transcriptional regulator